MPLLGGAEFGADLHEQLDERCGRDRLFRVLEAKAKDVCEFDEQALRRDDAATFIARLVHFLREVEEDGERLRRVEVFVHAGDEPIAEGAEVDAAVAIIAGRAPRRAGVGPRRGAQPVGAGLRGIKGVFAERERLSVVRREHPQAKPIAAGFLQAIADGDEVAERLAHLLFAHFHPRVMEPVADEGDGAGVGLGLGDLVLVVREDEVLSAAVDVNALAEVLQRHGGALYVPAGPAFAPGAVPRRLAGLRALPQGEVGSGLLVFAGIDTRAREERVLGAMRKLAVIGLRGDAVVDVGPLAVLRRGRVGVALFDEALDDLDHLRHLARGARVDVGGQHVEVAHVVHVHADEALDELVGGDLEAIGALDDTVVDVREVLDVLHPVVAPGEVTLQHIEDDVAHGVADVRLVVGRDAANVHRDDVAHGLERLKLAGERVGEPDQPPIASRFGSAEVDTSGAGGASSRRRWRCRGSLASGFASPT